MFARIIHSLFPLFASFVAVVSSSVAAAASLVPSDPVCDTGATTSATDFFAIAGALSVAHEHSVPVYRDWHVLGQRASVFIVPIIDIGPVGTQTGPKRTNRSITPMVAAAPASSTTQRTALSHAPTLPPDIERAANISTPTAQLTFIHTQRPSTCGLRGPPSSTSFL